MDGINHFYFLEQERAAAFFGDALAGLEKEAAEDVDSSSDEFTPLDWVNLHAALTDGAMEKTASSNFHMRLAQVCLEANAGELYKTASYSEMMSTPAESYEQLMYKIAASAAYAPQGMLDSLEDFLNIAQLEENVFEKAACDTAIADAVISASFIKAEGFEVDEDLLEKLAVGAFARLALRSGRGFDRMQKALYSGARRVGKTLNPFGKTKRVGEYVAEKGGIKETAKAGIANVRGKINTVRGKWRTMLRRGARKEHGRAFKDMQSKRKLLQQAKDRGDAAEMARLTGEKGPLATAHSRLTSAAKKSKMRHRRESELAGLGGKTRVKDTPIKPAAKPTPKPYAGTAAKGSKESTEQAASRAKADEGAAAAAKGKSKPVEEAVPKQPTAGVPQAKAKDPYADRARNPTRAKKESPFYQQALHGASRQRKGYSKPTPYYNPDTGKYGKVPYDKSGKAIPQSRSAYKPQDVTQESARAASKKKHVAEVDDALARGSTKDIPRPRDVIPGKPAAPKTAPKAKEKLDSGAAGVPSGATKNTKTTVPQQQHPATRTGRYEEPKVEELASKGKKGKGKKKKKKGKKGKKYNEDGQEIDSDGNIRGGVSTGFKRLMAGKPVSTQERNKMIATGVGGFGVQRMVLDKDQRII